MTNDTLLTKVYAADVRWKLYNEAEDRGESEEATDALYFEYHETVNELAEMLAEVSEGSIDKKTAVHMAHWKRDEIAGILNRATV